MGPVLEREAAKVRSSSDGQIEFFQVNFKENKALCMRERVFQLPAIHLYVPGIGRVSRFTCTAANVAPKLRRALARFTSQPDRLPTLRSLASVAVEPIVQYQQLVGALKAFAHADEYETEGGDEKRAGLRNVIETDEAWLAELQRLFSTLDRNSDGKIDSDEIETAIEALGMGSDGAAPQALSQERPELAAAADVDGSESNKGLSFSAFVRLMTSKSVAEYALADKELLPAFRALDRDGDGTITMKEMTSTMASVCATYPEVCTDSDLMPTAFDAFDLDGSGALDYEEFVALASRKTSKLLNTG